ncbi:MAG TPA: hypothetical protein VFG10_15115 [Saprospiraceae bacterium]|nr:hypothetical protein [Saprospiraceae bacterium]
MKSKHLIQFIIGIFSIALLSCSPKYYIPTAQNIPLIDEKGKTNLTIAVGGNQFEFLGAYGLEDALALQVNGGVVVPPDEDNGNGGSGKFIEAGLGYYSNINDEFLFDAYGLLAFGTMENHFPTTVPDNPGTTGKISANLVRFSIQPSLNFHKKNFSISGSTRFMTLNYSDIKGSLIFDNADQVNYLKDQDLFFLLEPALTFKAGSEKIKFQFQLVTSINLTNDNFEQDDILLSMGLNYQF